MDRQNSEPLFGTDVFKELLKNNCFSQRLGSTSFTDILDTVLEPSDILPHISEDPQSYKQEFLSWHNIDEDLTSNFEESVPNGSHLNRIPSKLLEDDSSINSSFDNNDVCCDKIPSLGFESWPGELNFSINFESTVLNNSKWCYNSNLNKLYIMRNTPVPIEVSIDNWQDGTITITPIFLKSLHVNDAVLRCHNHRIADEARGLPNPMHIIQVVNPEAIHKTIGNRHTVEVPVGRPAPGETHTTIYIQSGCWNTCVGPSRRNFCIIFTLFNRFGQEIGRQVVNFKCCQMPIRDMETDINKLGFKKPVRKAKSKLKTTKMTSKKRKIQKTDDTGTDGYENLRILSEIVPDVKKYVNCLMAERFAKKDNDFISPFPEVLP